MRIVVISLQRSQDRRQQMQTQFESLSLPFEFFDAIDGRDSQQLAPFLPYYSQLRAQLKFATPLSKAEIGCYASHFSIWQLVVELNEPVLVLEDDVTLNQDFIKLLPKIEEYARRYSYLRIGANYTDRPLRKIDDFLGLTTEPVFGAFGYVLTPLAAAKLLKYSRSWEMIVDKYLDFYWRHGVLIYQLQRLLVEPERDVTKSTIGYGLLAPIAWYWKIPRELYRVYFKLSKWIFDVRHRL